MHWLAKVQNILDLMAQKVLLVTLLRSDISKEVAASFFFFFLAKITVIKAENPAKNAAVFQLHSKIHSIFLVLVCR